MTSFWNVSQNNTILKNHKFLNLFGTSAFQLRNKIYKKKTYPERSKIKPKNDQDLGPFLDRFLIQLESILKGFWPLFGVKLATKATKTQPQNQSTNYCFLEGLQVDFGWSWAPQLGGSGGGCKVVVGWLFWLLEPSWGQDGPKRPQKATRRPPRPILERFW